MKIRIKGNSIRYRLTKSEVEKFCNTGSYEEITDFGHSKFKYCLKSKEGIDTMEATFNDNTITLFLEKTKSENWHRSNKVGFKHHFRTQNETELFLLLEKDFVCLDETIEDQSDNYPNPKLS